MNLTRQTHIGIAALFHAVQAKGRLIQIGMVAKSCNTTPANVAQVTRRLTRLGWLEAHRGRGGGLTLADGMETLPIGEARRNRDDSDIDDLLPFNFAQREDITNVA